MAKTIGTAGFTEVLHKKCGKGIARVINGVLHVECVRKGCREWAPLPGWVQVTPLAEYRQIKDLIVVGPEEIEKAFLGPNGENPLMLTPGWCPRLPVPYSVEQMKQLVELCQTKEWQTRVILWLALPEADGMSTSLIDQYVLWGVAHDGLGPGRIGQDVMWSNWFLGKDYLWAKTPPVSEPTWNFWKVGYELPCWSTNLDWEDQKEAARKKGLRVSTATSDTLMLNLVAIATGRKLRSTSWARTATIFDGRQLWVTFCSMSPLGVSSGGPGLCVDNYWVPEGATGSLGLAVEGVPSGLSF